MGTDGERQTPRGQTLGTEVPFKILKELVFFKSAWMLLKNHPSEGFFA